MTRRAGPILRPHRAAWRHRPTCPYRGGCGHAGHRV